MRPFAYLGCGGAGEVATGPVRGGGDAGGVGATLRNSPLPRMVPPKPTSHACVASTNATARNELRVGMASGAQCTPSMVRIAVPKSPSAIHIVVERQLIPTRKKPVPDA